MFSLILVFIGLLLPTAAFAQGYHLRDSGWSCYGFLYCSSGSTDFVVLLTTTIVSGVAAFIAALAIVVFLYGALRMVISQGQEGKEAGKKALIWASLGLIAALLTQAIIMFIRVFISSIT